MDPAKEIQSLELERANVMTRMEAIRDVAQTAKRDLTEDEDKQFQVWVADVERIDGEISRAETFQKLAQRRMEREAELEDTDPEAEKGSGIQVIERSRPPGTLAISMAICRAIHKGDSRQAIAAAKSKLNDSLVAKLLEYPEDELTRAAVEVGDTVTAGWAAELVEYRRDANQVIELLRPRTVLGQFDSRGLQFGMDRRVHIPRIDGGQTGYIVGEGKRIPATAMITGEEVMTPFKFAALTMITNELARYSNPSAVALIRDDLFDGIGERVDTEFVSTNARVPSGATITPGGIYAGITPITGQTTLDDPAAINRVRADAKAAIKAVRAANTLPDGWSWMMHSDEVTNLEFVPDGLGQLPYEPQVNNGVFHRRRILESNIHAKQDVGLIRNADVIVATGREMRVDMSMDASVIMSDDPETDGAPVRSAFGEDAIVLRGLVELDWLRRHDASVQLITTVDWDD